MAKLAFLTFGILRQPYGMPDVQGFIDATPDVWNEIQNSEGYICHAIKPRADLSGFVQVWGDFGPYSLPRFYQGSNKPGEVTVASTLSIWQSVRAVRRFAYSGLHKEALARRESWFLEPDWPSYVMWWIANDQKATWQEASMRIEHLHDQGSTPWAFNFGKAFDEEGRRISANA